MNASFMSLILNRIKIISELAFYAFDLQTFVYYIAVTMLKSEDTVMIKQIWSGNLCSSERVKRWAGKTINI